MKLKNHTIKFIAYLSLIGVVFFFMACENDMKAVNELIDGVTEDQEIAENVEILYSDSAIVRIRIKAPTLVRKLSRSVPKEEFPDGIEVEFLNESGRPYSWLKADYAIRDVLKKEIITRQNVEMKNKQNERILSSELIWDEVEEYLYTEKYVKIIQTSTQDTTDGFGFETNQEFTKFEIKRRGSASLNAERLKEELNNEP